MYADAGGFLTGVPVEAITSEARTSNSTAGGKQRLVTAAVRLAVSELDAEIDRLLPADEVRKGSVAAGVLGLFDALGNGLHDEQKIVVMAWLQLPTKRRKKWRYEERDRETHPGRELADDYDRRLVERLVAALRRAGWEQPQPRGDALARLVRGTHLAVARGRPLEAGPHRQSAAQVLAVPGSGPAGGKGRTSSH